MNNLKPSIFLTPVIAFLVVGALLILLLKKAKDKRAFKRFILTVFILAFLFNEAWELVQMPFYKDTSYSIQHILFCTLASVVDAIMVLLLYFVVVFIFRNLLWIQQLEWQHVIVVILIGGAGAALAEVWHVSSENWTYSDLMPIIPIVNAGMVPVLQFMILPILTYLLSSYYLRTIDQKKLLEKKVKRREAETSKPINHE